MKRIIKALYLCIVVGIAALVMSVGATANSDELTDGLAALEFANNEDWDSVYFENGRDYPSIASSVIIKGNGTYTVSVESYTEIDDEITKGCDGLSFVDIKIVNCEKLFPTVQFCIDSFSIDGVDREINGLPYIYSSDYSTHIVIYGSEAFDSPTRIISNDVGRWYTMSVTFTVTKTGDHKPIEIDYKDKGFTYYVNRDTSDEDSTTEKTLQFQAIREAFQIL